MSKQKKYRGFLLCVLAAALLCVSCEKSLGYGVLLWAIPEKGLLDGDVLKVCIKSNISRVWVVENEKGGEASRFEIPLWQLTEPVMKGKAVSFSENTRDYRGKYAKVMLDALPVRAEATNSAKRVYRLKMGEVLHIIREHTSADGEAEIPMNGGVPLEGKWLKVVTEEGTQGWCFSHNLDIFTVTRGEAISSN